jgi:hypothetical protein
MHDPPQPQTKFPQSAAASTSPALDAVLLVGLDLSWGLGMETGRMENRQLFALGGIYPRGWPDHPAEMLAECLIEGIGPEVEIEARFEQTVERRVFDAADEEVEDLLVTGRRYTRGEETIGKQVRLSALPDRAATISTAGSERMELVDGGATAGSVLWSWKPLHATVEAWSEEVRPGLHRIRVAVANRLEWEEDEPERNRLHVLHTTQVTVESPYAAFASRVGRLSSLRTAPAAWPNAA